MANSTKVTKVDMFNAIKAIPGLNIAGDVLNGIVAGVIVAALGEGSVYIFEQIYTGQKSVADTEWVSGIRSAQTKDQRNNTVYNLSGQKTDASHKGIVIKNGKKYLVK